MESNPHQEEDVQELLDAINDHTERIINHIGHEAFLFGYLTLCVSCFIALGLNILGKLFHWPTLLSVVISFVVAFVVGFIGIRQLRKGLAKAKLLYHLSKEEYEHTSNQQSK